MGRKICHMLKGKYQNNSKFKSKVTIDNKKNTRYETKSNLEYLLGK